MAKPRLKTPVLILLCSLTFLVLLELLLRSFKPQLTYSRLFKLLPESFQNSDFIPFTLKANYHGQTPTMDTPPRLANITTNSLGLRGKEIASPSADPSADGKRILILGDSYTFGLFVDDKLTYPSLLQDQLQADHFRATVINAGYADGHGPDSEYAWLINQGIKFKPDVIIYGFFVGNDFDDINEANWVEKDNLGLPKKIIDPNLYIDQYGRLRSKVKDQNTIGDSWIYRIPILRESHLAITSFNGFNYLISRFNFFSKNNPGWNKNPYPYILSNTDTPEMVQKEKLFLQLVNGMKAVADESQAKFLVLMIPINFQINEKFLASKVGSNQFRVTRNPFEKLKPIFDQQNIPYLDLLEKMKPVSFDFYPENGEVHFSAAGHLFTSMQIKQFLEDALWLKN